MKNKFALLTVGALSILLLAGCENNNTSNKKSSSSQTTKVSKKVAKKSSVKKQDSSSVESSSSSSSSANADSGVHLTGGQSTIDYITKVKGDKGWTIEGGTYGGAHGAPTTPDYIPYNVVKSADGSEWYYVYQNGKIVEQKDMEQNGDQVNSSSDSQDTNVSNYDEDND